MRKHILRIRKEYIPQRAEVIDYVKEKYIVLAVGIATFSFGFLAGAILNLYLLAIQSPLVLSLRASLSYKSSIFGDGIILPIVNMVIADFILRNKEYFDKKSIGPAFFSGFLITTYFHISQAVTGLTNWAMPEPWQWNLLGQFHALYMFSVASLVSLFYIMLFRYIKTNKTMPKAAWAVTAGAIIFLILLRLDYITVSLASLLPQF